MPRHAASEALRLTQTNYRAGLNNYLVVLNAGVQQRQAAIAHLGGQAQRLQDTVALFVALGGGWWNAKQSILRGAGRSSLEVVN